MSKIECANPNCENEVDYGSQEWACDWNWVLVRGKTYDSCSSACSRAIRSHYDVDPRQIGLFDEKK